MMPGALVAIHKNFTNLVQDLRTLCQHWHLNVPLEDARKIVVRCVCRPLAGEERFASADRAVHAGDHRFAIYVGHAAVLRLKLHGGGEVGEGEVQRIDEHGEIRDAVWIRAHIKRTSRAATDRRKLLIGHPGGHAADRLLRDSDMLARLNHGQNGLKDRALPELALVH